VNEYNLLAKIIACPVCNTDLSINDDDNSIVCSGCTSSFRKGSYIWDFLPEVVDWSSPTWETWKEVQANGLVGYQCDPEHNLAVGEREDIRCFASFCNFRGLVLDVGCGPQSWPAYFEHSKTISYVGVDPLIEDSPGEFIRLKALAEFLPFRADVFDHILFVTSLDHFAEPITALKAAARVCKPAGEIDIWLGEKTANAPKPAMSPDWYRRLRKPDLAEDLFHIKRLSDKAFSDLAAAAGLTLVQIEIHTVDEFRKNYFYRLKTGSTQQMY
jgi:SAM-dependent methyltransferase